MNMGFGVMDILGCFIIYYLSDYGFCFYSCKMGNDCLSF